LNKKWLLLKTKVGGIRVAAGKKDNGQKKGLVPDQRSAASVSGAAEVNENVFPIIGIGASAGGLEALELFLENVPERSGMAFVIVQHLDPNRKGLMVELLQRATALPVFQVKEQMTVQPNSVYVIPPNKDMSIFHGVLHLFEPAAPRGLRLPIDYFFRSLADDQQERSVGVILSGMGSDGTLGLGAIKERGGAVFVQDPASAKFDSMPNSVIENGLADVVAPVEGLPARIISYHRYKPLIDRAKPELSGKSKTSLDKVMILLRTKSGHDFSNYKKTTIYRRLERRMGIHQISRIADYVRFLQENPQELELLFKELLIGVTSFFRDPAAWEQLKNEVMPELINKRKDGMLRAWVPGCSTGEEAYSLAFVFKEAIEQVEPAHNLTLQIFATDLSEDAIIKAREAVFPPNIAADISPERLKKFFEQVENGYQVAKPVREMVVFARQNMIMDPPFTRLDILSCRNLLIYLGAELQKKLLPLMHYSLNPGGILFLGNSESIGSFTDLFEPLAGKSRIYRRLETAFRAEPVDFPSTYAATLPAEPAKPIENLQHLVDQLILNRFSPACVLVNASGDILYISGRTGKYLEPAAGKANWNLFAMTREGLSYELKRAFQRAIRQGETVVSKRVVVKNNGGNQAVDFIVQPLEEQESLSGLFLIVFRDVDTPPEEKAATKAKRSPGNGDRTAKLEAELRQVQQELFDAREEMQQTNQETISAANEELQSTNEELQSTNEELTTSKEEMQSLNEELQTINHELQMKVDELFRTTNDLKNLMESTEIAVLFLDNALRIRRFTTETAKIFKLIPSDAGRLITDLVSDLTYPDLAEDARQVLRTLSFSEKSVSAAGERWFTVRIMPYRTLDDRIDGLVITFSDITASKTLETALRQTQVELEERMIQKDLDHSKAEKILQSEINSYDRKEAGAIRKPGATGEGSS
jgi:chemotaxis methyl-accepting protein methylase/PAS domain-containing protein